MSIFLYRNGARRDRAGALAPPIASPIDAEEGAGASHARQERELICAAQAGDRGAFGQLCARYGKMVHGLLLARVSPAEADDLAQDVFLCAMEKLPTLKDWQAFGGWLAQIARNRATDSLRSRLRTEPLRDNRGYTDPDRAAALQVLLAIQELPSAYRETLTLRLVEGLTGPEIAVQVGLTPESVRVNLHRGMQLLRRALGEELGS